MLQALDSLPEHKLIAGDLEAHGEVCAIGAVGKARGVDMSKLDPNDIERVAAVFGIGESLVCEIVFENDEAGYYSDTPERRYMRVRSWVESQIRAGTPA
jgi:hypothetical protein